MKRVIGLISRRGFGMAIRNLGGDAALKAAGFKPGDRIVIFSEDDMSVSAR